MLQRNCGSAVDDIPKLNLPSMRNERGEAYRPVRADRREEASPLALDSGNNVPRSTARAYLYTGDGTSFEESQLTMRQQHETRPDPEPIICRSTFGTLSRRSPCLPRSTSVVFWPFEDLSRRRKSRPLLEGSFRLLRIHIQAAHGHWEPES